MRVRESMRQTLRAPLGYANVTGPRPSRRVSPVTRLLANSTRIPPYVPCRMWHACTRPARAPMTDPLVIFTPSGKRGHVPAGTTVLAAARLLGVDLELGLRRPRHLLEVPGRARPTASSPSTASPSPRTPSRPGTRSRSATTASAACRRPPPRLPGADPRRRRHRRAARVPGPQAGRAQARRGPPGRHGPGHPPLLRRGGRARHARALRRPRAARARPRRAMGHRERQGRPPHPADAAAGAAQGRLEGHLRRPPRRPARPASSHVWPGLLRRRDLRPRHRRRLDHHRRPSLRPRDRRSSPRPA